MDNNNEMDEALKRLHAGMLYAGMDACIQCGRDGNKSCSNPPEGCLIYDVTKTMIPDFKAPCELIEGWPGSLEYLSDMIESSGSKIKRMLKKPKDVGTFKDWIKGEQQ